MADSSTAGLLSALRRALTSDLGGPDKRLKAVDLIWVTSNLATATDAGLPVARAVDMLAGMKSGSRVGELLEAIGRDITDGSSVAEAFAAHEGAFGPLTGAFISAGEASGRLSDAFAQVAAITANQHEIRRKVRSALSYPAVVIVALIAVMFLAVVVVVPAFRQMFTDFGTDLPWITKALLAVTDTLTLLVWPVPLIPLGALGLVFSVYMIRNDAAWRAGWDRLVLRLPVFGSLVAKAAVARAARTVAALTGAGIPLVDALGHARRTANQAVYEQALVRVAADVGSGVSFHEALTSAEVFPELMCQLAAVGEESGQLVELMARYATSAEADVRYTAESLSSLLQPILLLVIGAGVGFLVMAVYFPVFKLLGDAGGS